MSGSQPDGPFEIPVAELPGGRSDSRRASLVAFSIVAVVGVAFGLARWTPGDGAGPARSSATPAASSGVIAVASAAPSTGVRGSSGSRIERLLDIPDQAIAGGPRLTVVELADRDLVFHKWTPGRGVAEVRTMRDALGPDEPMIAPLPAPVTDMTLLIAPITPSGGAGDHARIVNASGDVIWTVGEIAVQSGGLWSPDGSLAVLASIRRQWHLVRVVATGPPASRAVDTLVDLPVEVFLPAPMPIGSMTVPRVAPRTVPIGFSADARWIYGGVVSPELAVLIGQFRVRVDGSRVERVLDFAVGRPDGLAPQPGTIGGRLVDSATGRLANWRVNPDTTGGPPILEVRDADSAFAFDVDVETPLGSAWGGDGSLYVLAADAPLFPNRVIFARVDRDGALQPPLLETGPIAAARLLDVRDGFAALLLWTSRPTSEAQLVVVDLADPSRVAALPVPEGPGFIVSGELGG